MSTERRLTDVPAAAVDAVISDFVSEGCTATKMQQSNGLFTVIATCPETRGSTTRGGPIARSTSTPVAAPRSSKPATAKSKATKRKVAKTTKARRKTKAKRKAKSK